MTNKQRIWLFVGLIFVIGGLIFFFIPYLVTQKTWFWSFGEGTGFIGDTIGGIVGPMVGFIAVILTFLAFYIQFKANQVQISALNEQKLTAQQQEKQILIQQFENNFFEILKLHRENVKEFDYRNNFGRNVIIKIINEFFEILTTVQNSKIIKENKLDEQDVANISFTILFFGTDETVNDVLENRFRENYPKLYQSIINNIIVSLREHKLQKVDERYIYNGHQSRLGHYFRHLWIIVLFVHKSTILTVDQKKDYIRILRAQLSNHEQVLLFFHSISHLGLDWELSSEDKLITEYNLIRNIPLGSIYGFDPKRYYPNIRLEHDFEAKT